MKNKVIGFTLVLFLALGLAFLVGKANVMAQVGAISETIVSNDKTGSDFKIPSTVPGSDETSWVVTSEYEYGYEIPMDQVVPGPDGQMLISTGLQISGPAEICFPFKGAQFGWHGLIRVLDGEKWWPVATTTTWEPDEEGKLMACAMAPAAGTYALFAWWEPLP